MSQNPKEWVARIDDLKRQVDSVRPLSPEQENRIFSKFRLDWNYHSNAIEGNQLSEGETRVFLLEGLTAKGKPLKDYLDIRGHNQVIEYLLDFIRRNGVLTEVVIREMHKILLVTPYEEDAVTPDGKATKRFVELGVYKATPNQVMRAGAPKVFTSPLDTPVKMGELMAWLRKEEASPTLHPVEKAALFHHQFVSIHPFDDGNGRMSRILMNLLLMKAAYPPVVIKTQERDQYFATLVEADAGDPKSFIEFIADKLVSSLELYLRGARGDSIDDVDDINRKIALLKKELDGEPDATGYSREAYQRVLKEIIIPLLRDVITRSSPLDPLFRKASAVVYRNDGGQSMNEKTVEYITSYLQAEQAEPHSLGFEFRWEEFKKTPFKTFNIQGKIDLRFRAFVCELTRLSGAKSRAKNFLYSAQVTPEEIKSMSAEFVEMVFDVLQQNRAKAAEP